MFSSLPPAASAGPGIFAPDQLFVTIPQKSAIVVTGGAGLASEPASKATIVWTVTSTPPPGQPFSTMTIENPNQRSITRDELDSASRALHNVAGPTQLQESTIEVIPGSRVGTLQTEIANPSQQMLANAVNATGLLGLPSLRLQLDGIWYSPRSSCSQLDSLARGRAEAQARADASTAAKALGLSGHAITFPLSFQRLTPTLCSNDVPTVTWSLLARPQAPLGQATRYQTLTEMMHATGRNRTFSGPSSDEETAWLNSTPTNVTVEISPGTSTTTAAGDASATITPDAVLLLGITFGPESGTTPIAFGRFAKARLLMHVTRSAIDEAAQDMNGSADIEIVPFARSCAARDTAIQTATVRAAAATAANARLARHKPGRILFTEIRSVTSDVICGPLPTSEHDALERLIPLRHMSHPGAGTDFSALTPS